MTTNKLWPDTPAMPQLYISSPEPGDYRTMADGGLTARQHAAIALCVPDSGTQWLDDMIRARLRDEFAARAMQGMIAVLNDFPAGRRTAEVAGYAYGMADAMLAARQKGASHD